MYGPEDSEPATKKFKEEQEAACVGGHPGGFYSLKFFISGNGEDTRPTVVCWGHQGRDYIGLDGVANGEGRRSMKFGPRLAFQ